MHEILSTTACDVSSSGAALETTVELELHLRFCPERPFKQQKLHLNHQFFSYNPTQPDMEFCLPGLAFLYCNIHIYDNILQK